MIAGTRKIALSAGVALGLLAGAAQAEPRVWYLSQFTSGPDAASIAELGKMFTDAGGKWESVAVPGGDAMLAKLRSDVVAGNPPAAVALKGPEIVEWNNAVGLVDLDDIATKEGWDDVIAPELKKVMKPEGKWLAVPMNIHRINWNYANKAAMDEVGIAEMPKTWADFNAACEKAIAAGKICLAHLSNDWADQELLEIIVYGQDVELYRKAFGEGDPEALRSEGMVKALDQLRLIISKYTDPGIAGRDIDAASDMMANGKAIFYLMGDWALGTLQAGGHKPGEKVLCGQAPTDWGKAGYILNADSTVFFKRSEEDITEGQKMLAHFIMTSEFQNKFNIQKGSIPARLDADLSDYNVCQQISQKDLQASIEAGTMVGSLMNNMTILEKYRKALADVTTEFVNTPEMSSQDAANQMGDEVEAQM